MSFSIPLLDARGFGVKTETADTVITRLIPPVRRAFTRLTGVHYRAGGTAHTLTVMRPLNKTTLTAAAAAAQAVINIAADPGDYPTGSRVADNAIAANDYVVIELADGTHHIGVVSSVASLAITLTANLPTGGAASGATVWFFGIITDLNPCDGLAHPQFTLTASTATVLGDQPGEAVAGIVGTVPHPSTFSGMNGKNMPMILHSGNATAQGWIESCTVAYTTK